MKTNILGVNVDAFTNKEVIKILLKFLEEDKPHIVFTPNPEMIMLATKDNEFMQILNNADLVVPDGIGVVLASKLNKIKIKERVAGYDLVLNLFDEIRDKNFTIYFLGSAPGVADLARQKMEKQYPGIKIVGTSDGYFDNKKEKLIIKNIKEKKPDIVLVGMSMGKQEKWINRHKNRLGAKILIGVGGSFDGFSGKVKRAPDIYQKLGIEWLYRLIKQPSRIKRQIYLPIFALKVVIAKFKETIK